MLNAIKQICFTLIFGFVSIATANAAICQGTIYNPLVHLNFSYFSLTVSGVPFKASAIPDPIEMKMPPICVCPSLLGFPIPGIGITYWEPLYVEEIAKTPGCLTSLGGINILPAFKLLTSNNNDSGSKAGYDYSTTQRSQVHFYEWPGFTMLELFSSFMCRNKAGINLAYITEVDPFWQSLVFSSIIGTEGALFANIVATMSTFIDKPVFEVTAQGILPLIHVVGESTIYPFEGNSTSTNSSYQANRQIGNKFIARQSRLGLLWTSIGPTAICFSHPSPFIQKNQYRPDLFWPVKTQGLPIGLGSSTLKQYPPVVNFPSREENAATLWVGKQCCLRF